MPARGHQNQYGKKYVTLASKMQQAVRNRISGAFLTIEATAPSLFVAWSSARKRRERSWGRRILFERAARE
jgi:hypothetical protein